jgi:hypothetical protein
MGTFIVKRIVRFAQDAEWAFILLLVALAIVWGCAGLNLFFNNTAIQLNSLKVLAL